MTIKIAWVSPLSDKSGVGTFSYYVTEAFPESYLGDRVELTILYSGELSYNSRHLSIPIVDHDQFYNLLLLFDFIIYNIGNNDLHHGSIFKFLERVPGIVIMHDYTYQHYIADQCINKSGSTALYGAFLVNQSGIGSLNVIENSKITSRNVSPVYTPWETDFIVDESLSKIYVKLASALIVHSNYAQEDVQRYFKGPILRLNMPFDQKPSGAPNIKLNAVKLVDKFNFTIYGHINSTKSIEIIFEAFASLHSISARANIVVAGFPGAPDYIKSLQDLAQNYGIRERVTFELSVSERRLSQIKNDTNVFINLRYPNTEGGSVSLVEQLLTGRPVIVYNTGCYAELPDGGSLKINAIGEPDAIAQKMTWCLDNIDKLDAIGLIGMEHAKAESCSTYSSSILSFLVANKRILQDKSGFYSQVRTAPAQESVDRVGFWLQDIGEARLTLELLRRRSLISDPHIILSLDPKPLAEYLRIIILGMPEESHLQVAIENVLNTINRPEQLFIVSVINLLVLAVYEDNSHAKNVLRHMSPIWTPELWQIILNFRPVVTLKMCTILINGEMKSMIDGDDFTKTFQARQRVFDQLRDNLEDELKGNVSINNKKIAKVMDLIDSQGRDCTELLTTCAGRLKFFSDKHVIKSGFYPPQADGIWTRKVNAYILINLDIEVTVMRIKLGVIGSEPDDPKFVILKFDGSEIEETLSFESDIERVVELPIPKKIQNNINFLKLNIECDRLTNAAPFTNGKDLRDMGVYIMSVFLK